MAGVKSHSITLFTAILHCYFKCYLKPKIICIDLNIFDSKTFFYLACWSLLFNILIQDCVGVDVVSNAATQAGHCVDTPGSLHLTSEISAWPVASVAALMGGGPCQIIDSPAPPTQPGRHWGGQDVIRGITKRFFRILIQPNLAWNLRGQLLDLKISGGIRFS